MAKNTGVLVGRQREKKIFESILHNSSAHFLALYGRRRVGKTYLIRNQFADKGVYIEVTGMKDGKTAQQLTIFHRAVQTIFAEGLPISHPANWDEAFAILTRLIANLPGNRKVILFLDELPWLASRRSGLLQQLDHYWNTQWSQRENFILITCGSAASWMLKNIVNARGGLHNRVTRTVKLQPFELAEVKAYLKYKGIKWGDQQVLELFMAFGGIPFYLEQLDKKLSAAQNIDNTCFSESGLLYNEFPRLFQSLFEHSDVHIALINELSKHRYGLPRKELISRAGLASGGRTYNKLYELEESGFIDYFAPYGKEIEKHYRIVDEFCWFYFNWISKQTRGILKSSAENYWAKQLHSPAWYAWAGYSFELFCFKQVKKIAKCLDINSINFTAASWYQPGNTGHVKTLNKQSGSGFQIDLLFDREDGVITLCEVKHTQSPFVITKDYAMALMRKIEAFREFTKTDKDIALVFVSNKGIKWNLWARELVTAEVKLADIIATGD